MITLTDIAYVRSGVADLDAAVRFATDIVGLELAAPTEIGVAHLRADHRHHCLALVEGPSGVISSGFTVADSDALAAAETELERAGFTVRRGSADEARSRRVREFIAFDDPFGNRIELVSQPGDHRPGRSSSPGRRASPSSATSAWTHPTCARPTGSGAPTSTRGCRTGSATRACLMRIDPVHHKLAVFRGDEPGLCHMNFQVASIDDVFRNWHFLVDHGVEIEMGPGRHPQSTAIFLYFLGPEGFTYEYSFGVRRIEDDAAWTPRTFDPDELGSIDMWLGPVRPCLPTPAAASGSAVPASRRGASGTRTIDGVGTLANSVIERTGVTMIYVAHPLPVNAPDEPQLNRDALWDGLVLKANNALPFVPSMTFCEVVTRHSDTVFDRDIEFRGQDSPSGSRSRHRTESCSRASPAPCWARSPTRSRVPDEDLRLRFSFALVVAGIEGGSAGEQEYADSMTGDYLKAVEATLNAMRRVAAETRRRSHLTVTMVRSLEGTCRSAYTMVSRAAG